MRPLTLRCLVLISLTLGQTGFEDRFSSLTLDAAKWALTHQGDTEKSVTDVSEGRLRMTMSTMGTRDDTVKYRGVRTRKALNLSRGLDLSYELDWNNQANGSYMSAAIYLCSGSTNSNPADENIWLKVEHIGVPPGQNGRILIAHRDGGVEKDLFTEGWPDKQRAGRHIDRQKVRIVLRNPGIEVWENGVRIYADISFRNAFSNGYLYLQMSSHSNYRERTVYFHHVSAHVVTKGKP